MSDLDDATPQELRARIAQLEDQLHQAELVRDAIVHSTTWRMMKPVRQALAANRRVHGVIARFAAPLSGRAGLTIGSGRPNLPNQQDLSAAMLSRARRAIAASPMLRNTAKRAVKAAGRVAPGFEQWLSRKAGAGPFALLEATQRKTKRREFPNTPVTARSAFAFIDLVWSKSARPIDLGISSDGRSLAAGIAEIAVLKTDPNGAEKALTGVDFRTGGNSMRHVCYGFSFIEEWGTWTSGGRSSVLIWLPEAPQQDLWLEFVGGPYKDAFDTVSAQVSCEGRDLGTIELNGLTTPRLPLPAAFVQPRQQVGENAQNLSLDTAAKPEVSFVILNYNKPGITLACVLAILNARMSRTYEIIVLDNGSTPDNARELKSMNLPIRLVRLRANRFFGEGNNIAAEHARAPVLLFLNNDAFVTDNSVDKMYDALTQSSDIGAIGPVFRYPDGSLQEAGAFINKDGSAYQRGKGNPGFDVTTLPEVDKVDYVSAACLMMRRDEFQALGGFDLRYDPAYYEDSDLCLRLLGLGKKTAIAARAEVIHIENATTSDPSNRGLATDIVERHKQIFMTRWRGWLERREPENLPHIQVFDPKRINKTTEEGHSASLINCIYSPFPLVPGGGERYLLGAGLALRKSHPTAVVTPDEYSAARLNTLMRDLGYPAYQLFGETERKIANREIESFILMGNELFPTRPGYGEHRVYHCQFPFPTLSADASASAHRKYLASFQSIVVNSAFTRDAYQRELSAREMSAPPIHVIHPPVQLLKPPQNIPAKENLIISIGRFSPNGHSKRQDIVLQAFSRLLFEPSMRDWRLVLCGVVPNDKESIEYYEALCREAKDCRTEIILAPSRAQLEDLLWRAKVYVSATGFGVRKELDHWKCEHFGITVVEAASAGCVPLVYEIGGPTEIVDRLGAGFKFGSVNELAQRMMEVRDTAESRAVRDQLIRNCDQYSETLFFQRWGSLVHERV